MAFLGEETRLELVSCASEDFGARAEHDAGGFGPGAGGELGRFGEEAVAGVDGVDGVGAGDGDEF